MKKIFTVWFLTNILICISQAQILAWETTFPGATIHSHYTTQGGTTWVAGKFPNYTIPDSAVDSYIALHVDSTGKVVGGIKLVSENITEAYHIGLDEDQNIVVFGPNFSIGNFNYFFLSYNQKGEIRWKRRIYMNHCNAMAMEVQNDNIALTGSFLQLFNIYQLNQNVIEKSIGKLCDPDRDANCPRYVDAFFITLNTNGDLIWTQKIASNLVSVMRCWPHTDKDVCDYYYTKYDALDIGVDLKLDNDKNTYSIIYGEDSYFSPTLGDIKTGNEFYIIKFDSLGEPKWTIGQDLIFISNLSINNAGDIYCVSANNNSHESMELIKYNSFGEKLWNVNLVEWASWELKRFVIVFDDSLNSYVGFNYTEEFLWKFDKQGDLLWKIQMPVAIRGIKIDHDNNLYVRLSTGLQKYVQRDLTSYRFTGSGNWKDIQHWEAAKKPPLHLPKWDTIYIQTAAGDSCVMDSLQVISKGANLIVEPGSHLIVAGDLTNEPPIIPPTPTRLRAFYEAKNPIFHQGNGFFISLKVDPGQHPISSGITVEANLSSIGGTASQLFYDDGSNGDPLAGDFMYSFSCLIPENLTTGYKSIPYKAWDNEGRKDSGLLQIQVLPTVKFGSIVISQVYTGGDQQGSTFSHDFIELFNRTKETISLEGMSLQYCDENLNFNQYAPLALSGSMAPESYYLIQLSGDINSNPLPQPDLTGIFDLKESGGKIAVVNSLTPLNCESASACSGGRRVSIIDLLGYSASTNSNYLLYYPAESIAIRSLQGAKYMALKRKKGGLADTNNNKEDFFFTYPQPRNASSPFNNYLPKIHISQIYTKAGLTQNSYFHQFIELFNPGTEPVDITGWSVQYADSTSDNWQMTALQGTIQPRSFYLIRQAFQPFGSKYLPITNVQGNIYMNPTSGKVALVNHTNVFSAGCPSEGIMDFVGYGNADCFEGPYPATQNADLNFNFSSLVRSEGGCKDTDNNLADWRLAIPAPKNHTNKKLECLSDIDTSFAIDQKDGQIYPVKNFDGTLWMMKNLNYTGGTLPENDTALGRIYGRTFIDQWNGYCPVGYRLPSEDQWRSLANFVGGVGALKDTLLWNLPNTGATNASGFGALPFGWGEFKGKYGYYWTGEGISSDIYSDDYNPIYIIFSYNNVVIDWSLVPEVPIFIRCVKN